MIQWKRVRKIDPYVTHNHVAYLEGAVTGHIYKSRSSPLIWRWFRYCTPGHPRQVGECSRRCDAKLEFELSVEGGGRRDPEFVHPRAVDLFAYAERKERLLVRHARRRGGRRLARVVAELLMIPCTTRRRPGSPWSYWRSAKSTCDPFARKYPKLGNTTLCAAIHEIGVAAGRDASLREGAHALARGLGG